MSNRPRGYGLTADVKRKIDGKYEPELEEQVATWVAAVLGEGPFYTAPDQQQFKATFEDGVLLCRLMNTVEPTVNIKINNSKMAFKKMENIGNFLQKAHDYGVNKTDMFQTVDLYEGQNLPQVINGIIALSRKAQAKGYDGPTIGPKEATANKRDFSEESLRQGEGVIGLQMGSNKGASQAGMAHGRPRQIQSYYD